MDKQRFDYLIQKSREILETRPPGAAELTEAVMGSAFEGGFLAGFWFYEKKLLRGEIEGVTGYKTEEVA